MGFALAVTEATPLEPIVAVVAESVTKRCCAAGGAKVKTPPATGSTGLLAATMTARGLANAVPACVDCGVLPATGVSVKPWLWKAPMSGLGESSGLAALVGGDAGRRRCPAPMAGLPGSRAMVWVGPP